MNDPERSVPKKPYAPPRLTVFGELRALTQAKRGNKNDGGAKPATKASGASA